MRRRIAPISLAVAGALLLTGCIFLPIPEHRIDGSQKDFRAAVDGKHPSIRVGVTRGQIIRLLGPPAHESSDRRIVAYDLDLESGYWIGIGCAFPNTSRALTLILWFDEDGRLTAHRIAENDNSMWMTMSYASRHEGALQSEVPGTPFMTHSSTK